MAQPCTQEQRLSNLEYSLFGNGNPGVKQKVNTLENDIAWIKKLSGWICGMVATLIVSLLIAGIIWLVKSAQYTPNTSRANIERISSSSLSTNDQASFSAPVSVRRPLQP